MSPGIALAILLSVVAGPALAQPMLRAELVRRYDAPEANQGVAVDATSLYAVGNSEIGRYDRRTGKKTGAWSGDPKVYPHLNSCAALGAELVCASSNYPATPMTSTVEVFDRAKLTHLRSISLGHQAGSLTWMLRRDGAWWGGFANYDGRGGEPGRDHTATALVKFDGAWKVLSQWSFPASVLARFAPRSASGGAWATAACCTSAAMIWRRFMCCAFRRPGPCWNTWPPSPRRSRARPSRLTLPTTA